MTLKQAIEQNFDKYYQSDEVWDEWVNVWIEKNPDVVFEIVSRYLSEEFEESENIKTEFSNFVDDRIEAEWEASIGL